MKEPPMMKMKFQAFTLVAAVLLGGCALQDKWTTTTEKRGDRGPEPVAYEQAIRAHLNATLRDPFSMQIQNIMPPVEDYYIIRSVTQSPTLINVNGHITEAMTRAWLVRAEVNAKNGYGGYVGWKKYEFYFQGEKLIGTIDPPSD